MTLRKMIVGLMVLMLALGMTLPSQAQRVRRANKPLLRAPSYRYGASYYPSLKWRVTLGMAANTVPAIADLELDGVNDIVFPAVDGDSEENVLYRLTDMGDVKWKVDLPAPATAGVTLGDVDRDGTLDILVACGKTLLCFDARAREKWRFTVNEPINSFPTVADLDGDGKPEVLFGANDNMLHVLSSRGKEKWRFVTKSWIVGGVAVGNLRGDKKLEIVFGSMDFNVYCVDSAGKLLWKHATGDWVQSSPCLADVDRDGGTDVVVSSDDGEVYCLSRLGTLKWKKTLSAPQRMKPYLVVVDLDGDGTKETLVALPDGQMKVFTAAGEQVWSTSVGGGIMGSPLVADMNGDGVQDILVATQNGNLVGLNIWGSQQWSLPVGQTIETTPILADLDRDGKYEIYVANLMEANRDSGFFSQYELSARGGKGLWMTLKGDPYRTGTTQNANDYAATLVRGPDYATAWEPYGAGYRPRTGVQPPRRLRVTALPLDDVRGNRDGALDPGETAIFKVQVANYGKGPSYDNLLTVDLGRSFLKLDRTKMYLGWIAPGATKSVVFRLTAPPISQIMQQINSDGTFRDIAQDNDEGDGPDAGIRPVFIRSRRKQPSRAQSAKLQVFESGVQAAVAQATVFNVPPLPPVLRVERAYIIDRKTSLTSGNGNGRLDSGESVILRVLLRNDNMTTAEKATATIVSNSHDVLPTTPTVPMVNVVPLGGRQIDFGLRVARQVKDRKVAITITTYAIAPKVGSVPPHSDTILLPLVKGGVDTVAPSIALSAPDKRICTTTASSVNVNGVVSDDSAIVAFRFDKYPVAIGRLKWAGANRRRFSFKRALNVGENVFPIAATDSAGNSTTQWLRVIRKPVAGMPKVTRPKAKSRRLQPAMPRTALG